MMKTLGVSCLFLVLVAHILATNATKYKDCEYNELKKCNKLFMDSFRDAAPRLPLTHVYCNGFQVYANCLQSSTCSGEFIDLNRFMILQHMIMDKTLETCPRHDLKALKNLVQAVNNNFLKKIKDITRVDADGYEDCAQDIHRYCATHLATDLSSNDKMCFGVGNFLHCYENPGFTCKAKIYQDFAKIIRKVAENLLIMFKAKKGVMPNC